SPNGVGLSPDEQIVYVADTESSRLFAFDIVEPGVLRKGALPRALHRSPRLRSAGLSALRQPRCGSLRQYRRGDLDHRPHHRDRSRRQGGPGGQDARRLPDQHLLWRQRHEDGLHHPFRQRSARRDGVARARLAPQFHGLGDPPMKAAVLHAPNQPLTIEEVALTKPGSREVLLRTAFAGLCHSDLHFIEGLYPHPAPCVLGHESAGIVEAVGDGVSYVKPGDHVITCLSVFCGTCPQCLTGHPNLCENTEVKMPAGVARRMTWKGGHMNQAFNLSSFAEQMLVHENAMVKIDPDIPLDRAALVGCGVMTGVGAVFNAAKVEPGATVAVIGCGGVGLSAVNGAALAGAERIIAIDTQPSKLE